MKSIEYKAEACECCGQSKTYALAIDRGTVKIVKQIARFISKKGINAVHPRKEMEGSYLTSNEVGNLSRARFHGLIARIDGESGNYVLTRKGSRFLHGERICQVAVISKVTGHQEGYFNPSELTCVISDFNTPGDLWEGINYSINEGHIIENL